MLKVLRLILILLLISVALSVPSYCEEKSHGMQGIHGNSPLLTDGKQVNLVTADTPEVHESPELYLGSRKAKRDIRSIRTSFLLLLLLYTSAEAISH